MSEPRREGVRDLVVRARREQIVEAATRVFAEKGFRRATIREVAQAAGISEGTIYNYFEDKDALLMAILEELNETERRAEDFEEGMAETFGKFFAEYLRRRMSMIWDNREVFRVVLSEMLVNAELRELYLRQVVTPTMTVAEEYFRAMVEHRQIRSVDVPLAVRTLAGTVMGLLVLDLLGDEEVGVRWQEIPEVVASIMSGGLESDEDAGQG